MANVLRRAPPPPPMRKGNALAYQATYSYKAQKPNELSFEEGDLLYIVDQTDRNWWTAKQNNKQGLIPSKYVTDENLPLPIMDAARRGNLYLLEECLSNGVSPNSLDKTGSSPLHAAAMSGYLECVQRLLQEKNIQINIQNKTGDTALHNCSRKGHEMIVETLLKAGADYTIKNREGLNSRDVAKNRSSIGIFEGAQMTDRKSVSTHPDEDYLSEDDDSDQEN